MKKYLYLLLLLATSISLSSHAQIVEDVVSQEQGYAIQVWYSMENGEVASAPKSEWDIAFSVGTFSSSIHINSAAGNIAKVYPNGSIDNWETVDIAGFDGWPTLNNSATSWEFGAFDQNNSGSSLDFGWGIYNPVTHFVTGDSIYIIQTPSGNYKKLKLINLTLAGVYNFEIADINGENLQELSLNKSDYSNKLFGYYSIQNNEFLDREPSSTAWDLLFTQYTDYVPTAYTVAGVLHHPDVTVAQVNGVDQDSYIDFASNEFSSDINTVGYDWKSFNGTAFEVVSDVVYFVQEQDGDIWKVVFTGFGGSSNGDYYFSKEKMITSSTSEIQQSQIIGVFPNPASDQLQVVTSGFMNNGNITIFDLQGRVVSQRNILFSQQLQSTSIDVSALSSGLYILNVNDNISNANYKFFIK